MNELTKDDLLEFMKKHGPERVNSITDKDSAIKHFRTSSKLYKQQRDQYKAERDTLIDDIAVLKANISRLERENEQRKKEQKVNRTKASLLTEIEQFKEKNEKLRELNEQLTFENINCEHEIKALREQNYKYCKLGNHIRMKAEANPSVDRYIELNNYITRLEKGE